MAVNRRNNTISQGRIDVPAFRSIESAVSNDFDQLIQAIVTGTSQGYILRGFEIVMTSAIGNPASSLPLQVDPGALMHIDASQSGTTLLVPVGTPNQVLNSATNPNVVGVFSANALNYVTIDYVRTLAANTAVTQYLWNPTSKSESSLNAPTAQILSFVINISTVTPTQGSNLLPIAVVETDINNNVTSITDARYLYGRLGQGGTTPNPFYTYPWPQGRNEMPSTSTSNTVNPFYGGDKAIGCLKDNDDAIKSVIREIQGTEFWYQNAYGSLSNLRSDLGNTVVTGAGSIAQGIAPDATAVLTTTGNISAGSNQLTNLNSTTGIAFGQYIFANGVQNGTTVALKFVITGTTSITKGTVYKDSVNNNTFTVNTNTAASSTSLVVTALSGGLPSTSGTLTWVSGNTNDPTTVTFSTYYLVVTNSLTMSSNAIQNITNDTVSFLNADVITRPGQLNWDQPIDIDVIGSPLTYSIAANASSPYLYLTNDQCAYLSLVRGVTTDYNGNPLPNLTFTNGQAIVTSVNNGAPWTNKVGTLGSPSTSLVAGDFIKVSGAPDSQYYQILSVDGPTQVTLTTNFSGTTSPANGTAAAYAFGNYYTSAPQTFTFSVNSATANVGDIYKDASNYLYTVSTSIINGTTLVATSLFDGPYTPTGTLTFVSPGTVGETPTSSSTILFNSFVYAQDPRAIHISNRGTVALNTNTFWLFLREDNGSVARIYLHLLDSSLSDGQSTNVASGNASESINNYDQTVLIVSSGAAPPISLVGPILAGTYTFTISSSTVSDLATYVDASGNTYTVHGAITSGTTLVTTCTTGYPPASGSLSRTSASGTGPLTLNYTNVVAIALPNNTRQTASPEQFYVVNAATLQVFLNGQALINGIDYLEVGPAGNMSNQVSLLINLVVGDVLDFKINSGGGSGLLGPAGAAGAQGPQGPPGADAAGGPVAISTQGPSTSIYSVLLTDCVLLADCPSGGFTYTLPSVHTPGMTGKIFYFKKIDSNLTPMTITAASGEQIDGLPSLSTSFQYKSFTLICNGTQWLVF